MKVISIRKNPQWAEKAKAYCEEKWNVVSAAFARILDTSIHSEECLPDTWIMLGGRQEDEIKGFYQLCEEELVENHNNVFPWLTTLFVEECLRGYHYGEMLINHAKYEAGCLGFDKLYLTTDHINFYERYGFREIGVDRFVWGCPTKIYEADTFGEFQLKLYDEKNPPSDALYLKIAEYKGQVEADENPAVLLHFEKYFASPESFASKWFMIVAYRGEELVGRANFIRSSADVRHWYVGDLSVKPAWRRKRMASRILKKGFDRIRQSGNGDEYVCAYIEEDNIPSICLHEKLGFTNTGECFPFEDLVFGENETTYRMNL